MSAKKKPAGKGKPTIDRYPAPDPESLDLTDERIVFKAALSNDYQSVCGAFDQSNKELHPLAALIIEKGLLNARDEYNKSVFDLASLMSNKEFLKAFLDRANTDKDKLNDEQLFSLRDPLKADKHGYNYMHYACVWNRLEVVKFLYEQDKLIIDPELSDAELGIGGQGGLGATISNASLSSNNKNALQAVMKTLGSLLLRTRNKYGETPLDLAKRYKHQALVDYLMFAEKRQSFIDYVNDIKQYTNDTERHQNKLAKDDKKKLEKLFSETTIWLEKTKESVDQAELDEKIKEVEGESKAVYDKVAAILEALNSTQQLQSTANMSGNISSRSKGGSVQKASVNSIN